MRTHGPKPFRIGGLGEPHDYGNIPVCMIYKLYVHLDPSLVGREGVNTIKYHHRGLTARDGVYNMCPNELCKERRSTSITIESVWVCTPKTGL